MTNETRISANSNNKTATVSADHFIADITPEYCLINLGHETCKIPSEHFRNMYLTFEIAEQFIEEK